VSAAAKRHGKHLKPLEVTGKRGLLVLLKAVIFLMLLAGAEALHAARPSSRNFKSSTQKDVEAKIVDQGDVELADSGHRTRTVEKIKFLGPKQGWGFVTKESACYSLAGKYTGVVQVGDIFKYSDIKESSKNDMLLAVLREKGRWSAPCLLPCDALATYEGDPERVDIQIVGDLRAYFLTKDQHESRQEELLNQECQKNPHYNAYQQVAKEYNSSLETALQMVQEASTLTGIRKTRADEALREFKYRQVRLQHRLDEVAQKYREWKEKNPIDLAKIHDPQLDELSYKLKTTKSKVADLVPKDSID